MYLRTTKRHNKDGSTVEYYQLAETRWDPTQRRPAAHIIYNFGRADTLDHEALLRLAQSISRVCQSGIDVPPEVSPPARPSTSSGLGLWGSSMWHGRCGRNWALARSYGAWSRVAPVVRPMSWRSSRW